MWAPTTIDVRDWKFKNNNNPISPAAGGGTDVELDVRAPSKEDARENARATIERQYPNTVGKLIVGEPRQRTGNRKLQLEKKRPTQSY